MWSCSGFSGVYYTTYQSLKKEGPITCAVSLYRHRAWPVNPLNISLLVGFRNSPTTVYTTFPMFYQPCSCKDTLHIYVFKIWKEWFSNLYNIQIKSNTTKWKTSLHNSNVSYCFVTFKKNESKPLIYLTPSPRLSNL